MRNLFEGLAGLAILIFAMISIKHIADQIHDIANQPSRSIHCNSPYFHYQE